MFLFSICSDSWNKSTFYNGDPSLPVFKWCSANEHFSVEDLGQTLIVDNVPSSKICSVQPTRVCHNTAFVVDIHTLRDPKDVRADENGVWLRTGSPVAYISVHTNSSGDKSKVFRRSKMGSLSHHYKISRTYYRHSTSPDFHRVISTVYGE